jgi:hypothetical protein
LPNLEKVINCHLTPLSRLLRILRFYAQDLKLKPSTTAEMRWRKGPRQHLRFTRIGDSKLEQAHARHFVWPGKGPFRPPRSKPDNPSDTGSSSEVQGGPARHYWSEFVFEAYVNHCSDVIFLKGLPEVRESRPHSSVNRR